MRRGHPRCRGLQADWCFPNPSNNQTHQDRQIYDLLGHPNNILQTIGNSTLLWIPSPWGWAVGVNIPGTFGDRLSTGSGNTFDLAAPLTVQCAIMSPNPSDNSNIQAANSKESNGSSYGTVTMQWNHTAGFASHAWQIDQGSGTFGRVQYPSAFVGNRWYDLFCTIDSAGNMVIYQDGAQAASGVSGVPAHGTNQVLIGFQGNQGDTGLINTWAGYTSILRYWSRVVPPAEVREIHAKPFDHYSLN